MNRDKNLFDFDYRQYPERPGYVPDSDTSREAAISIDPYAKSLCIQIFRLIKDSGLHGLTCDELEIMFAGRHQTISARLRELVLTGHIRDSTVRRRTRSGRYARVYVSC